MRVKFTVNAYKEHANIPREAVAMKAWKLLHYKAGTITQIDVIGECIAILAVITEHNSCSYNQWNMYQANENHKYDELYGHAWVNDLSSHECSTTQSNNNVSNA